MFNTNKIMSLAGFVQPTEVCMAEEIVKLLINVEL